MRKLAFLISLGLSLSSLGQTVEDVELFHQRNLNGSPRFTAMGGAFTALGNDPSAIGINPASGAVNRFSNLSFSIGFTNQNLNYQDFYGQSGVRSDFNTAFENFGLNLLLDGEENQSFSIALSVNRLADFNRNYSVRGNFNPYTLGQYWAESSAGQNVDFISNDAFAAWDSYLLVSDSNDNILSDGTGFAYGEVINGDLIANSNMHYTFNQNGSSNETNIAFAFEDGGKLYYGLSLGFPTLNFRREEFITEDILNYGNPPYSANQYTFRRLNNINATGFNFKLGFIYAPVPEFRLGASYQSNSWFTVNQFYESDVVTNFAQEPFAGVGTSVASSILETGQYSYRLRTPSILRLGLASVLAKKFIISIDYQFQSADNNRLYTNRNSFNVDEGLLQSEYQPALDGFFRDSRQTISAGLEWRIVKSLFVRGGYRLDQSMYKDALQANTLGDRRDISFGLGYQRGPWNISVTAINSRQTRNQVLYRGIDPDSDQAIEVLQDLQIEQDLLHIIGGVTYKF